MKSLGIRGRLFLGFGFVTFLILIGVIITTIMGTNIKASAVELIENHLPSYNYMTDLDTNLYMASYNFSQYMITKDPQQKKKLDHALNNITTLVNKINTVSSLWTNPVLIKGWQDASPLIGTFVAGIRDNQYTNNSLNITEFTKAVDAKLSGILDILDGPPNESGKRSGGIFDVKYDAMYAGTQTIINGANHMEFVGYLIAIITVLSSIIISLFTAKSILRHIDSYRQFSSKIAAGDLRHSLTTTGQDEIGQLGQDLNKMTSSLATVAKQINTACHNIVTSLSEVKQSVDVQSTGASEQASSINEITASLAEIEKSSAQTMEKARALGNAAERTKEKGQQGLEAVEQSILGMKDVRDKVQTIAQTILDLSSQTQQVGEITSAVNNLAQQLKMLALNASIEAAKAGEAGKGFAVVATEVKNLAEQSEQSTTQVQRILEDIKLATEKAVIVMEDGLKGVDHGKNLVEQTGEIVRSLSDVIHETTLASQQIEAAVKQEGIGIEQITAGMNEINQVTASFVGSSSQTTEAIDNLTSIAKDLKEQAESYKV